MFENASSVQANITYKVVLNQLRCVLIEIRPKQWYKNFLLFIGIIFSLNLFNLNLWFNVFLGFTAFCLLSGCVYILNDIVDIEKDKLHPVKRNRPIASGMIKPFIGYTIALVLLFIGIIISVDLGVLFSITAVMYIAISLAYNFLLKNVYLVDIFTLSSGMVLRAIAGCVAISVLVSPWLILCTFLVALYLALSKRRHELIILESDAASHRKILEKYSLPVLGSLADMTTSAVIVSYSLYTFFSGHTYMMLTIPLVLYGIFRYTDNVLKKSMGGEPELMFKDPAIILCMVLWVLTILLVIMHVPEAVVAILSTL